MSMEGLGNSTPVIINVFSALEEMEKPQKLLTWRI
jgi:hypothetical protein